MTREVEVADYLRSDATLRGLLPGGIYPDAPLDDNALTNAKTMPKVWAGGVFNATALVRQRAPVPTGDLQSVASQHTSVSQAFEVWVYALTAEEIEAALARIYTLTMGHRFNRAFRATQIGAMPIGDAPNLPKVKVAHEDYRMMSIRRPVTA